VTAHPTAEWTAQQMLEAFPFDTAPKYLLRDRDAKRSYGRTLLLVRPVSGVGEQWVEEGRIRWTAEADGGNP
jgi:hypothetical protein